MALKRLSKLSWRKGNNVEGKQGSQRTQKPNLWKLRESRTQFCGIQWNLVENYECLPKSRLVQLPYHPMVLTTK